MSDKITHETMSDTLTGQIKIELPKTELFKYTGVMKFNYQGKEYAYATSWRHKLIEDFVVLRSLSTLANEELWIHVSVSRSDNLPSWFDIMKAKNEFIGADREAYQVLPAQLDYINACKNALHIWSPLDKKRRVANLMDLVKEIPL